MATIIQQDPTIERKRKLAQNMMAQGQSVAPIRSPLQGVANLAKAISGKYMMDKADESDSDRKKALAKAISDYRSGNDSAFDAYPELGANIAISDRSAEKQAERQKDLKRFEWDEAPQDPNLPKGMRLNAQGQPEWIPGYLEGQERVKSAGKSSQTVTVEGNNTPRYEVGTIPQGYMMEYDEQGRPVRQVPIPEGPAAQEQAESKKKEVGRDAQTRRAGTTVIQDLNRALNLIDELPDISKGDNAASGVVTNVMAKLPRTTANQITKFTESALSNVGLDTLQAMRENSPTGGALGQVPIQQQKRLEQVLGSLDIEQRPEVLQDNIKRVINIYTDIIEGSPEERALAVKEGKMTQEQSDAIDKMYYPLSFDERGNKIEGSTDIENMPLDDLVNSINTE